MNVFMCVVIFMEGNDEVIFTGSYKDFYLGIRFDLGGKSSSEVADTLTYLSSIIEPSAYQFSGIDAKKIAEFAKSGMNSKGNSSVAGLEAICAFLESHSPTEIKNALLETLPKSPDAPEKKFADLLPAAESYLLNCLLNEAGLLPLFKKDTQIPKSEKQSIDDVIGFIGKYQKWIAIKKLGVENVKDYEVSALLSGINMTLINKSFDFKGLSGHVNDSVVSKACADKRKSYVNLALALRSIQTSTSTADNSVLIYLICKACETIGYRPYANIEMLTDAYKDIKAPRTRGRKPKG